MFEDLLVLGSVHDWLINKEITHDRDYSIMGVIVK